MRRRFVQATLLAVGVLGGGAAIGRVSSAPLLVVRNPSPSMPTGWYLRVPLEPTVDRIVVIDPPPGALAAGWPADVRLIKPIAAVGGDHVCVAGRTDVLVNGQPVAPVPPYPAPRWDGCRTLEPNELFLIAPHRPDSIDGRIYGPVTQADVLGVFVPLWTEALQ
jgi:type IV secretory pathway protease TraF